VCYLAACATLLTRIKRGVVTRSGPLNLSVWAALKIQPWARDHARHAPTPHTTAVGQHCPGPGRRGVNPTALDVANSGKANEQTWPHCLCSGPPFPGGVGRSHSAAGLQQQPAHRLCHGAAHRSLLHPLRGPGHQAGHPESAGLRAPALPRISPHGAVCGPPPTHGSATSPRPVSPPSLSPRIMNRESICDSATEVRSLECFAP